MRILQETTAVFPEESVLVAAGARPRLSPLPDALALLLLLIAAAALFYTAPKSGDFWWSDAPRHAMDGAFYRDLVKDMPFGHVKQYAMDYYLQYPALTLLFYPPVYPLAEALVFAIFGVSHLWAQFTIALFYFAAGVGAYRVCRYWMTPVWAFSTVLLFTGLPEVALWGRQVMLEIPAFAFLIWVFWACFRYTERARPVYLYLISFLMLAGVYTKQTVIFAIPVLVWMIGTRFGRAALKNKHVWIGGALFCVGLIPLAIVTLRFGSINVNSVTGGSWTAVPVFSIAGWLFYLEQLPAQVGWAVILPAAVYAIWCLTHRTAATRSGRFMAVWFAVGYVFFSLIALKEPRHTVFILFPFAVFAVEAIRKWVPARVAAAVGVFFAASVFTVTLWSGTPAVSGYREAAGYVAEHAPRNTVVLFSGYRDGSFVFNLRQREDRRDLAILRSDKLLLRVAQRRELGVVELDLSEQKILDIFQRYSVAYIVTQPNFWDDLKPMRQLQKILHGKQFLRVAVVPVHSNVAHQDFELEIYRNLGPLNPAKERISLDLPIVGLAVQGTVGGVSQ